MKEKKLILIIDDDSRNIFALGLVLKAKGYMTVSATSVEEGMMQLEKHNDIGIILMDMMMPDIDGYEAIKLINANSKFEKLPIIAVTAQAMQGDEQKCLDAGAWGYISKPINIDQLITVMKNLF